MKTRLLTPSLGALGALTFSGTYLVVDDGGFGVPFTDTRPAIAAKFRIERCIPLGQCAVGAALA